MSWHKTILKLVLGGALFVAFGLLFRVNVIEELAPAPLRLEPEFVSMIFGGDIMLDRGVQNSVNKNLAGNYNALFEKVSFLKDFDIAFGNLEGTASTTGRNVGSIYSFQMDPAVIPAMKDAGLDILSLANNHVGDWTVASYVDTLARLKEAGILFTGGGLNRAEAEAPTIIEKNGIKVGFMAFSDVGPSWMEVEDEKPGLLIVKSGRLEEVVTNAAKQVDYLIVSFHWGDEYKPIHNDRQEYLAHKAVDSGAKIIIGHHPHVPQDTEVYSRKDCTQSSCASYIAYSLGNFIFDQSWSEETMKGLLLEIKLYKDGKMMVKKDNTQINDFFQVEVSEEGLEEEIVFK